MAVNYQDNVVLCGASKYSQKFYLNPDFDSLPTDIKQELKILCVLFTEDIGGTFELQFDAKGNIKMVTDAEPGDLMYDEIGSVLKIKQIQRDKEDLFMRLEMFYKVFALGMDPDELEQAVREGRFEEEDDEEEDTASEDDDVDDDFDVVDDEEIDDDEDDEDDFDDEDDVDDEDF